MAKRPDLAHQSWEIYVRTGDGSTIAVGVEDWSRTNQRELRRARPVLVIRDQKQTMAIGSLRDWQASIMLRMVLERIANAMPAPVEPILTKVALNGIESDSDPERSEDGSEPVPEGR